MWVTVSENLTFCLGFLVTTGSGGGMVGGLYSVLLSSQASSSEEPDSQLHEHDDREQLHSEEPGETKIH